MSYLPPTYTDSSNILLQEVSQGPLQQTGENGICHKKKREVEEFDPKFYTLSTSASALTYLTNKQNTKCDGT